MMRSNYAWLCSLLLTACDHGGPVGATASDDGATEGPPSVTETSGAPDTGAVSSADGTDTGDEGGTSTGDTGETGAICDELGELDPRRVLIETRPAVLADLGLAEVLTAIAVNAGVDPDPQDTHDRLFDTYRVGAMGEFSGRHCDDEQVGGQASLNGFPLLCPRSEGAFAAFDQALDGWQAIAVVNRVDMAPLDGSHCGEQRMVFANPSMVGRAFIIIEAQIPNPSPQCGVAACAPIASFWAGLQDVDEAGPRIDRLKAAFLDGDPALEAAGFGPFMSADHLTFGTGQIRTNNFVTGPWTLRQFELVPETVGSGTRLRPEPVPVSASPHDTLWNDLVPSPVGASCRAAMLEALPGLLGDEVATLGWSIPAACRSSESVEFEDVYEEHLLAGSGTFVAQIEARIDELAPGSGLDAIDVARRAQFAGSCIGCHEHSAEVALGGGLVAPASLGFVHVDEVLTEPCGDGDECFAISSALHDELLPRRMQALHEVLDAACEGGCTSAASRPAPGVLRSMIGQPESAWWAAERAVPSGGRTIGGGIVGAAH